MKDVKTQIKLHFLEVTQAKIRQKFDQSCLFSIAPNAGSVTENYSAIAVEGSDFL